MNKYYCRMTEHKFPMNNNLETWRDKMTGPTNPEEDVFSNKTPELDVFSNKPINLKQGVYSTINTEQGVFSTINPDQGVYSAINPDQGVISSSGCQTKTKISNHKLYQPGNFWVS